MDAGAVRAHMDAILSSSGFTGSDRMSRFLRYTVEMKLRGEESQIKEFLLGREVFDRGADYDPRTDPIVRVEARRLRQRLAAYYAGPGRAEPIRIEYPKGSYAPLIQTEAPGSPPASRRRWILVLPAAAAAIAAGAWMARRPREPLAVIPARWVWRGAGELHPDDEWLAEAVTAELVRIGRGPVVGWPLVAAYRDSFADLRSASAKLGAARVLVVAVREESGARRATAYLLDAASGRKDWVESPATLDAAGIARAIPR